ncbi:hypothetical protein [Spongorhabdus nitratireducens]
MYTDEDLNRATDNGIFSAEQVSEFRHFISQHRRVSAVDEENFRLLSGFNDIFVVIACLLLLSSSVYATRDISDGIAMTILAVLSWGLSEFFVKKRRMALPAIVLLVTFVAGVFFAVMDFYPAEIEHSAIAASLVTVIATLLHWKRFQVPITVAAGTAAAIGFVTSLIFAEFRESALSWIEPMLLAAGLVAFIIAMSWDLSDKERTTRRSDVAFWLHLLAAPLLVHPVFSNLGILGGDESLLNMLIVVLLYILMTLISLVIDRRAFMVSSLAYVLYALSGLFKEYGFISYSLAITGVIIGSALLLLSAFWHKARACVTASLPESLRHRLP